MKKKTVIFMFLRVQVGLVPDEALSFIERPSVFPCVVPPICPRGVTVLRKLHMGTEHIPKDGVLMT